MAAMRAVLIGLSLAASLVAARDAAQDVAAQDAAQNVAAQNAAQNRAAAQPAELHYSIDAAGSELAWELPATLHTVHGKAPELSGRVDAVPAENGEWSIQARIVVKAAAMVTGNASRDRNMREKVLETDRYPEIVFEARTVRADLSRFKPGERLTAEAEG